MSWFYPSTIGTERYKTVSTNYPLNTLTSSIVSNTSTSAIFRGIPSTPNLRYQNVTYNTTRVFLFGDIHDLDVEGELVIEHKAITNTDQHPTIYVCIPLVKTQGGIDIVAAFRNAPAYLDLNHMVVGIDQATYETTRTDGGNNIVFLVQNAVLPISARVNLSEYDVVPVDERGRVLFTLQSTASGPIIEGATTKGDKGDKGNKGDKGDKGDKGSKGDKGDKGNKGDKGDKGNKGDKGDKGTGSKGDKGEKGDKGYKGDKGDKGDKGPQGVYGPVGVKGSQGIGGPTGPTGPTGPKFDSQWMECTTSETLDDNTLTQLETILPVGNKLSTALAQNNSLMAVVYFFIFLITVASSFFFVPILYGKTTYWLYKQLMENKSIKEINDTDKNVIHKYAVRGFDTAFTYLYGAVLLIVMLVGVYAKGTPPFVKNQMVMASVILFLIYVFSYASIQLAKARPDSKPKYEENDPPIGTGESFSIFRMAALGTKIDDTYINAILPKPVAS